MLAQASTAITFAAFFTATKVGKTGLTITVDVYRGGAKVVTDGGAPNLVEEGGGLYSFTMAAADTGAAGNYYAVFKTADTSVDQKHLPSLWIVAQTWVERIDAAVSSRNATTPPTAAAIADATWDEALSGHTATGSAGAALTTSATDLLTNQVPGTYDPGSAGEALGKVLGISNAALYSPVSANNAMVLASGVQGGLRPSQQIIWLDSSGVAVDLSGATLTGWLRSIATGDVRAITGTLAVVTAASGVFSWTYSAADVADDGDFDVQFDAAFGSGATPARTIAAHWTVEASLA